MVVHARVDEDDAVLLEIPDARGELFAYALRVLAVSPWRCTLTRLDTGAVRAVAEHPGRWTCSCEDSEYKGFRKRLEVACKHAKAARGLLALRRRLNPQPLWEEES